MRPWILTVYLNSRSFASIRIFSLILCFFFIIHLILLNFPQLSVKNLISQTWIQSNKNKSFICDRKKKTIGTRERKISSSVENHLSNIVSRK